MGMTYVVGYNASFPYGQQWKELNVNSTTDMYLSAVLSGALKDGYPCIFEKVTEQEGGHFIHFDELSRNEFMDVVNAICAFSDRVDLTDFQKEGVSLWNALIKPLIEVDERYRELD